MTTTGIATLLYVDVFNSKEGYPAKAGYEYIEARLLITFGDENAQRNGFQYMAGHLDYYGFDPLESATLYTDMEDSDIEGFKIPSRKLSYQGIDYDYFFRYTQIQNEWVGRMAYVVREFMFLVPTGYDGILVYLSSSANWSDDEARVISDNFDGETLFIQLRR
jgi:hypothetical protein